MTSCVPRGSGSVRKAGGAMQGGCVVLGIGTNRCSEWSHLVAIGRNALMHAINGNLEQPLYKWRRIHRHPAGSIEGKICGSCRRAHSARHHRLLPPRPQRTCDKIVQVCFYHHSCKCMRRCAPWNVRASVPLLKAPHARHLRFVS